MAINLKHLETFYHFCQFHNMTRAAESMNVSQPAISQQIQLFQEECGIKLFYREGNQYRLTDVGESIFLLSKVIFARLDQIQSLLEEARTPGCGVLRIGTTKDYAVTLMPELVSKFQDQFPQIVVKLNEGNSFDLLARLRNRKEDLVVVARTNYDTCFKSFPFAIVELVLVARPDHPLSQKNMVSIKDLSEALLIIREKGSGSRDAILRKLSEYEVKPSAIIESGSLSFMLAYVERRMGVSFVMSNEVSEELSKGLLKKIDLAEGNIEFPADIVVLRERPMIAPVRQFLSIAIRKRTENSLEEIPKQ
ncbi:MAG: LysR family transcriptional regulator [Deltaproteobacteria bacterium]|nr:LysR family transcriptional regulator [Deltaproteobacteria bacterium]